jgi:protein SCO1/2
VRVSTSFAVAIAVALTVSSACSKGRHYEVRGQVVAVDVVKKQLTIKHEDISGFMPAMTMPFPVRDERLLQGREAGELIVATLVVEDNAGYLSAIRRTGMAPLAEMPPPAPAAVLAAGDPIPDAVFVDQSGQPRRLSEWRGRVVAVTFIYTRCPLPNFCPLMDRHFADVQREIVKDAALRERVRLLSVSFDPEYDTPKVLAAHAARTSANPAYWTMLTGEREEVDRFASTFGVSIIRPPAGGRSDRPAPHSSGQPGETTASTEIAHNLRTAVIDSRGRLVTMLSGNEWQPSELLAHLRTTR